MSATKIVLVWSTGETKTIPLTGDSLPAHWLEYGDHAFQREGHAVRYSDNEAKAI